jgi:hypothetical protein
MEERSVQDILAELLDGGEVSTSCSKVDKPVGNLGSAAAV